MSSDGASSLLSLTIQTSPAHVFVWTESFGPCSHIHLTQMLCSCAEASAQGEAPWCKVIGSVAGSMSFLHSHSIDPTWQVRQWSCSLSLVSCYLVCQVQDIPSVTMGALCTWQFSWASPRSGLCYTLLPSFVLLTSQDFILWFCSIMYADHWLGVGYCYLCLMITMF